MHPAELMIWLKRCLRTNCIRARSTLCTRWGPCSFIVQRWRNVINCFPIRGRNWDAQSDRHSHFPRWQIFSTFHASASRKNLFFVFLPPLLIFFSKTIVHNFFFSQERFSLIWICRFVTSHITGVGIDNLCFYATIVIAIPKGFKIFRWIWTVMN